MSNIRTSTTNSKEADTSFTPSIREAVSSRAVDSVDIISSFHNWWNKRPRSASVSPTDLKLCQHVAGFVVANPSTKTDSTIPFRFFLLKEKELVEWLSFQNWVEPSMVDKKLDKIRNILSRRSRNATIASLVYAVVDAAKEFCEPHNSCGVNQFVMFLHLLRFEYPTILEFKLAQALISVTSGQYHAGMNSLSSLTEIALRAPDLIHLGVMMKRIHDSWGTIFLNTIAPPIYEHQVKDRAVRFVIDGCDLKSLRRIKNSTAFIGGQI